MAVTTNLSVFNSADSSGSWAELAGHLSGGAPAATSENYWQNGTAVDQSTGQAVGTSAGMQCDFGSTLSWTGSSKWVFLTWSKYDAATNIQTWANGGFRIGIGTSSGNMDFVNAYGSNFSPYPAGGWISIAVDPEVAFASPDASDGSGLTSGSYRLVGFLPNTLAKVTKGSPIVADIIRYGRGDIVVTGTETFSSMATADNADTVRWGLFIPKATGIYEWKGLMSLGASGTPVSLTDANKTILVQDTPRVSAGFNKIEVTNASSTVSLDAITFQGVLTSITGSAPVSAGDYETVTSGASVSFSSCVFADMGTFIFRTGTSASSTVFRRCGQIDLTNGGNITDGTVTRSEITSTQGAVVTSSLSSISGVRFERGATGHAVELDTAGSYIWTGTADTAASPTGIQYRTGTTGSPITPTSNGDELIYITTNGTYNINVTTGTTPSVRLASGVTATVNITGGGVSIDVNVKDQSGANMSGAYVYIDDDLGVVGNIANTTTDANGNIAQQSYSGGASSATLRVRKYGYKPYKGTISLLSNSNTTVTMITDPQQT
jgi:hypothetical protein